MRSLLLATAGHVNHGKSTLLLKLTGADPDRLPQEKARGMTLDLGFVHTEGISFIDVPGHEGLVRHTIAGQNGVDGALFIVAFNEGLQEQSREHARILNWLGVEKVLIVVTKSDLAENEEVLHGRGKILVAQARELFSTTVQTDFIHFSVKSEPQEVLSKIKSFFAPKKVPGAFFGNRFFIDRAFTLNGIGTVVTGTLTEGILRKGSKAQLWFANGKKSREVTLRSLRRHESPLDEAAEPGRLALVIDGAKPSEIVRGSCLLWGEEPFPLASSLALKTEWILKSKNECAILLQLGTLTHQLRLRRHPKGFWRGMPQFPLPLRRGDKVLIRVPQRVRNIGHTIASGLILDPRLPAGRIPSAPPEAPAEFARWCRENGAGDEEILRRLGLAKDQGLKILEPRPGAGVAKMAPAVAPQEPLDLSLLEAMKEGKWEVHLPKEKKDSAHKLVKAGLAFCVKDAHFLHKDYYEQLVAWLHQHFSRSPDLTIDDARSFFKTGRKNFLEILEFCDRHQFTFRKDLVRKPFKLPSYSRPSGGQP